MKIIHSLVFFFPEKIGGIEVYVKELAKLQQQRGHTVKILIPNLPSQPVYPPYDYEGIPVLTYSAGFNSSRKEFQGLVPGKEIDKYSGILQKEKPDIVHFHQLTSSNGITIFNLDAAKNAGARVVFTSHLAGTTCYTGKMRYKSTEPCNGIINIEKCTSCALQDEGVTGKLMNSAAAFFYNTGLSDTIAKNIPGNTGTYLGISSLVNHLKRRLSHLSEKADAIIALSNWYYEVLLQNGIRPEKLHLIKQAFAGDDPVQQINHKQSAPPLKILFLGRIYPEKGLLVLLHAVEKIKSLVSVELDIYGQHEETPYYKECRELIQRNENMNWHQPVSSADVLQLMKEFDVLCIPSSAAEMAPLVLQEAKACRLPVIGADTGGIRDEIIHNINGWLFPVNDEEALSKLLLSIAKEPTLLDQIRSGITPPRNFKMVEEETEMIYQKIMN